MANGRPLWFMGGVVTAWTGVRVALLWPGAWPLPPLDAAPVAAAGTVAPYAVPAPASPSIHRSLAHASVGNAVRSHGSAAAVRASDPIAPARAATTMAAAMAGPVATATHSSNGRDDGSPVVTPPIVSSSGRTSRFRADAWLVGRPGGGDNLAFGQLGASQAGARLTYALDDRISLSGRVSAPLRGAGREAGVGIDLKPTRLPLHLLVEQRIDLDNGATRPAVIAIAGGSAALPWRTRIDGYGQAGAVRRRGGFADAAAIVTRPFVTLGNTSLELGAGTWGAAQRGAARLDVGPSIGLVTPGAGGTLRLQLDYRARIAGRARPGSGPALTLGGSF